MCRGGSLPRSKNAKEAEGVSHKEAQDAQGDRRIKPQIDADGEGLATSIYEKKPLFVVNDGDRRFTIKHCRLVAGRIY